MGKDVPFRMIAIDLDGTLLSPKGEVAPATKRAVRRALDAGLLVCFATGRSYTESRTVLEAVEHQATAVFIGGAHIVDTGKRVTLHRMLMETSLAQGVCGMFEKLGIAALALQDHATAGIDYLISYGIPINPETARWMRVTKSSWRLEKNLGAYNHQHTIRVGIVAAIEEITRAEKMLVDAYHERVYFNAIHVPHADVSVLEVFDPSVNKWEGIMQVARQHGIKPSQIVAIGDDVNDLHMIRNAGLGVAMGNARDQVKAIAKRVIESNAVDGLAKFLNELVDQHIVTPLDETGADVEAA